MLRRLDLKDPWRSLNKGFWPEDLPLGRKTVIYGHNGSGKSTLSELLLSLADGAGATGVVWEHEDKQRATVGAGGVSPSASMAVFTRKWVEVNLSDFLDGDSASAIVTLGREAIDAREAEERLSTEIMTLRGEASEAEKQQKVAQSRADQLARDVQERIVSELKEFDYNHFTKNRYSIPKVQDDLRKYVGKFADSNEHAEALKRLGEGAPATVAEVAVPPAGVAGTLAMLSELLAETPTRVAIETLEGSSAAQLWVEQGLNLHEEIGHCLFCTNEVSSERRDQLARHFDESWLQIRGRAKDMLAAVTGEKQTLVGWHSALPATTSIVSELQPVYEDAMKGAKAAVDERVDALEAVESVLGTKVADPSATPDAPEWSVLTKAPSITVLAQTVSEHNDQAQRHEEVTVARKQAVLDYLVGSQSEVFRDFEEQAKYYSCGSCYGDGSLAHSRRWAGGRSPRCW